MSKLLDIHASHGGTTIVFHQLAKSNHPTFRQLSRLTATVTVSLLAFAALTGAASASSTIAYLDSYNATEAPSNGFCTGTTMMTSTPPGCGSTVTVPVVLASGTSYTTIVTGAVSVWGGWPFNRCGKPEPSSQFASPGISNRPAGDDAQFRFAIPLYATKCHFKTEKAPFFQANLGSGWFHPVAINGPSKPSGDNKSPTEQHPYTFTFVGQGVAPQFRFVDYHSTDNSGQFKIVITG
jgi:hypothetical protein